MTDGTHMTDIHGSNGTMDDGVIIVGGRPKGQTQSDDTGNESGISEKIVAAGEKAAEGMEKARGLLGKIKLPSFLDGIKDKVSAAFGKLSEAGGEGKLGAVKDKGLMVGGGVLAADGARRILKKDADGKRHVLKGAVEAAAGAGLVAAGIAAHKAGKAEGVSASPDATDSPAAGFGGVVGAVGKYTARVLGERGKGPGTDGPVVGGG